MEISKDGERVRYYSGTPWSQVDPKTGLVELDEGLFFHFRETSSGVQGSIRTKRWWGTQVLFREDFSGEVRGPEDLLSMSCAMEYRFRGGSAHGRYKAELVRKSKKQAKYMGSYEDRDARKVDSV